MRLPSLPFRSPRRTLRLLRYPVGVDIRQGAAGPGLAQGITFDRFVRACVAVKQLTESFQRLDTDRDGWVQMNYEQFMSTVLSAP